ncbi:MotE family protein [Bacillus sp. Marseille-P3661]|uniref:MotE family protein n=1 Tax=Bacillus sp. Marseille-P3661 TaxID=1936234 RepID=UPI000C84AC0F|nr:MgtE protein [Bacillus sp. Marseille-P3661]
MSKNLQSNSIDATQKDLDEKKSYSKLQWFIFVIIIPFLFSIAVILVVLTISGLNVFDMADKYSNKIPLVSKMVDSSTSEIEIEETVVNLKATIEDQKIEIDKLQADVETKQKELTASQQRIEEMTSEIQLLKESKKNISIKLEEVAALYETMSSKKAAAILSEMPTIEVLDILVNMNNESRAAVLEKMDPVKAAELTVLIKNETENTDNEQKELATTKTTGNLDTPN